ncbi:stage V sporulation protein AE [Dethiothermospora halolimnae]|uniref:stage V sporulation protein AE n=1 Tax=Dethiothermospora halolimnae TaxID=3114390 RepID=UPI003CCC30A5
MKRKIILVTDGDNVARKAVEIATKNVGGRCISKSAGNPTPITGDKIVNLIKVAKYDPVVIMVDDIGDPGKGKGERALELIINDPDMEVLGVIAVASNTEGVEGIKVDFSIDNRGKVINKAVNKVGKETNDDILYGDTVDALNDFDLPIVVGIGDPGKMKGRDDCHKGAPILTKALKELLSRSEKLNEK